MKKIIFSIILLNIFFVKLCTQNYILKGDASKINNSTYQLTTNFNDKVGMITSLFPLDLTKNFSLSFEINLGDRDLGGADGIAFVLSRSCNPVLSSGQNLGVTGISNSIIVDFDTHPNISPSGIDYNDIVDDHTAIYSDGVFSRLSNIIDGTKDPVCIFSDCRNAENGQWIPVRIEWVYINVTSQSIKVYINDTLRTTSTQNHIQDRFLNQTSVFPSYSASTGGQSNTHQIRFPINNFNYCKGENVTLTVPSLGSNYSWTGGITSTTNTATFTATNSQTITCNYTDFCNKPQSILYDIIVNINEISNPSATQNICMNGNPSQFSVATTKSSSTGIRYVYFNSPQTAGSVYVGGTVLADVNSNAGLAVYDAPELGQTGSLPNTIGTYYVYAILNPAPSNVSCRSFQEIKVNVQNYINNVENKKICLGEIYKGKSVAGVYRDTFNNPMGCDSIHILNLSVISPISNSKDSLYCNTFTFKNKVYNNDTNLKDTFKTLLGCDSMYFTYKFKSIKPIRIKNDTLQFCDTILVAGLVYYRDTLFPQSVKKILPPFCDSLVYDLKIIRYPDFNNISLTALPNTEVEPNTTVTLTAAGGISYLWDIGGKTTPQVSYVVNSDTYYSVKVSDTNKCDTIIGIKILTTPDISLPIIFSPNEDGVNETIGPNFWGSITVNFYKIYNRWGQLIFDGKGNDLIWDGKYKGEKQPQGSYVYSIEFIKNNKVYNKMGGITLIR